MAKEDREHWDANHADKAAERAAPSPFLVEHAALLPAGRTLDLACGRGRNARFLSERGHRVTAVDVSREALAHTDMAHPTSIVRVLMDLDAPAFHRSSFDAIVNVSFLDRRLFPPIDEWLRPGGILLFDTFLIDQAELGHPRNRHYLLQRNELLRRLCSGYRVLRYREGMVVDEHGRQAFRAGVIAKRRSD